MSRRADTVTELESLAARGRLGNHSDELNALTSRMPCSHQEGEQADVLGLNNPLRPLPTDIARISKELGLTAAEVERILGNVPDEPSRDE
jgi:hypothetical protein